MRKLIMLPGPTNVPDRVMNAMIHPVINHRGPEFWELYKRIVENGKKIFQTTGDIVVLSASGTGGVEAAAMNLIKPGDTAVVTVNGEFSSRLAESIHSAGGKIVKVESQFGDCPSIEQVEAALKSAGSVRALCVVYNETSTGVRLPWLKQASELAVKYGCFFVVDAISNFGGDELPVDELKVDFCIAGSQKCLAAPPGLVIVSISPRARAHIESNKERPTQYFNLPGYFKFYERFETPFTPAVPLLFALDEAFSIILEEGMDNRVARHKRCSDAFYAAFEAMGLHLFAREGVRSRSVIAVKYPEGIEDAKFRGLLEKHFGVVITGGFGPYRGKLFRVGSMGEVSSSHVYTTLSAIGRGLTSFGFRVDLDRATDKAGKLLGD